MNSLRLFDHLVCEREELCRQVEAGRPGGPEVDNKLELGRLHDRQVGGLLALEDAADIVANLGVA
jgi:hypothetical protein